jgi:signal transduction histidine kinase
MRERLRQFGGELVVSRAEPGTLVEAKVPILPGHLSMESADAGLASSL